MAVLETLTFRPMDGVDDETLLAADRRVQTEFVPNRVGFVRRTTARAAGRAGWIVVTLWETDEAARAAEADEGHDPAARALSDLVDSGSVQRSRYVTLD